jgi:Flp pilus assembly protein TadD
MRCLLLFLSAVLPATLGAQCQEPADLERAIKTHPTASAYDALGAGFAERREFKCAIAAFEQALRLDPNSWATHFNLGLALLQEQDSGRAITEFRTSVKLKPDSVRARNGLAWLFRLQGD